MKKKLIIPLLLQVMVYHGVAAILYLTAFITSATTVDQVLGDLYYNHLAAASVSHDTSSLTHTHIITTLLAVPTG